MLADFRGCRASQGPWEGGLGAVFAEPWQTVLRALQTERSFNSQTAVTVSLWTEAKTGPNRQSAQSHMTVNDRGSMRSQVKGQARKREVRKIGGWGGAMCWLSVVSHYLNKAPLLHPQAGLRAWAGKLVAVNAQPLQPSPNRM